MRNSLPLLSRPPNPNRARSPSLEPTSTPHQSKPIPTIRLISATPSAAGSSEANTSFAFNTSANSMADSSWASVPSNPSPLAPKPDASRKRVIVPKKSKLGLLGGGGKEKGRDFSDVVRRVGGSSSSTGRGGFEIYVDPTVDDPDIGEIVMVKKKKSRAGLDGMRWGALGEVTNVPPSGHKEKDQMLKVKTEEKEKWWSIGRGRRDSKDKAKEKEQEKAKAENAKVRSKSPAPVHPIDTRARFNSLDSGIMLNSPATQAPTYSRSFSAGNVLQPTISNEPPPPPRSATPTAGGLLAPPGAVPASGNGSIAIRAMRSVRSLARIRSWAQLKNTGEESTGKIKEKDSVEKDIGEGKKKKKKKEKEKPQTVRSSGSSFEIGMLTASPEAPRSLGKKKQSILGLGLPSTMRLPTVRGGSTASSIGAPSAQIHRLSVEGAMTVKPIIARDRAGSTISTASSLRPHSTSSGVSGASSGSSAASVRWDEEGLVTVKERRKKEREERMGRESIETERGKKGTKKRGDKESRRTSEGRKRTPLASVFPQPHVPENPIVTVEEATADGHDAFDENEELRETGTPLETPVKRARPRPVSEQLLGRSRPRGMYEDDDGDGGVISMLDAATNDLAQLINRLDLEATPGTPDMTPLKRSPLSSCSPGPGDEESPVKQNARVEESPVKKCGLRVNTASITSLRPYAQSRGRATISQSTAPASIIAQQIAPWPVLNGCVSPEKPAAESMTPTKTVAPLRLTHKRTLTLSPPHPADSPLTFQPLRPAKSRHAVATIKVTEASPSLEAPPRSTRSPSTQTFGSRSSREESPHLHETPSPVFKRAHGHARKRSSLVPLEHRDSLSSIKRNSMPIAPEAKRGLGLAGTMGGSIASNYVPPELDASDPDSDLPDELQVILSGDEGDTLSYFPHTEEAPDSPGSPPEVPLPLPQLASPAPADVDAAPIFRAQLIDDEDNHADIDEGANSSSSDDDTKKSFDFTGELQKLNESGASDRRSFVEQLENAFRTPAKIDLRYGLGESFKDGFLGVGAPPVPKLPTLHVDIGGKEESQSSSSSTGDNYSSVTRIIDVSMPSGLQHSESSESMDDSRVLRRNHGSRPHLKNTSSMGSRPSDGQLNTDFKFGGRPSEQPQPPREEKPLTLSDIIPPPSHSRSLSSSSSSMIEEDSSVLKLIFAKAADIPPSSVPPAVPRMRLDSDSSSKRQARGVSRTSRAYAHSRHSSGISFAGFESFAEVRRGFEFHDNRPAFYPPSGAVQTSRGMHTKHDSMFSIASISSYGSVVNPGSVDPFDYGVPRLPERPVSDDMSMSMSMSVDDTFSFIHRDRRRNRVDSDASSFYFRAPAPQMMQPYSRGHRRHESAMSVASMAAPPISLYNRSFGGHRRSDSGTSVSSVAQSYAMYGANGGRAAWARHRQDASVDSVMSDFSAMRLGRPGLGDKMLESGLERGMPLTSISASPPESVASGRLGHRASFDSILDEDRRSSMDDSLFEKTGHRTSVSSESVFGYDDSHPPQGGLLPPNQFRPLSMLSMASVHSPNKEDDTMITMFDGGHVRRRSVGSMYDASPCVRVEKRKHAALQANLPGQRLAFNDIGHIDSPNKARIIEKPSIASTSSYKFGGERMIRAQRGLLERQSLEESCLIADGEDLTTAVRPQAVFTRPGPASRSRSSTCTSSSGADTPPLSISDGSSQSEGSQSSIDLSRVNLILSNATHPVTSHARARARARARGDGHRRRLSQARMSRTSVYETIEEEMSSFSNSPSPAKPVSVKKSGPVPIAEPVFVVDGESPYGDQIWDDERGILALRKYYALRDEAQTTVTESKVTWPDTQFSVFALQSFNPPLHPAGMQALLEHSLQNFGPLPAELRRIRSRTQSRPSPYPQSRAVKASLSPDQPRSFLADINRSFVSTHPLQQVPVNPNVLSPAPILDALKPVSPLAFDANDSKRENMFGPPTGARPRVASNARRTALGWSKRSTGKSSTENKENISQGMMMTPGESLRLNRPRPRGRPTPASQRPIRV